MPGRKRSNVPLYVGIAETFTRQAATGVLRPGDRVPSLRKLSREQGVSLSTAVQAYLWLENRGYLEARPQSGFYIRTPYAKADPGAADRDALKPAHRHGTQRRPRRDH